jgi:CheY-specific phosphatase CheX
MSVTEEFEQAREDLEALLVECLDTVLREQAVPGWGAQLPAEPVVSARLGIHDTADDSYTQVEVRTSASVARLLAARMMSIAAPDVDDTLDAISELGNIISGNVKSLLRSSCRLSLPTAAISEAAETTGHDAVTVQALVLGQLVELSVGEAGDVTSLAWPGSTHDDHALEGQP